MAGALVIDITGEEEVARALHDAANRLSGQQMEAALVSGAQILVNGAKQRAPVLTGTLRRSIHILAQSSHEVSVGTNLVYAAMQEFGGDVVPVNGTYLRFEIGGEVIFTRGPVHIPAHPYMRPTFEADRDKAVREVAGAVRALIAAAS